VPADTVGVVGYETISLTIVHLLVTGFTERGLARHRHKSHLLVQRDDSMLWRWSVQQTGASRNLWRRSGEDWRIGHAGKKQEAREIGQSAGLHT
jgi:hypothetical protein